MGLLNIKTGVKTVTTAGTRVRLTASKTIAHKLRISAPAANSGVVYIGDDTVAAASGYPLAPGASVNLVDLLGTAQPGNGDEPAFDLNNIWADAASNGDKVAFLYFDHGTP